jgi:EAL domain-containing protein (putative c-di-GMP-specific phosphodiesterase class I)
MLATIAENGGAADRFVFELTEKTNPRTAEAPERELEALRGAGVRIAIDDFAHSPLSALQRLDVDILKIDRSVIQAASTPAGETMLRAVIQLARSLGIWPLGEGIETQRQFEILRSAGCRFGQGFLFTEPLAAEDVEPFIAARRSHVAAAASA